MIKATDRMVGMNWSMRRTAYASMGLPSLEVGSICDHTYSLTELAEITEV
jgi:hypothetical protein